MKRFRYTARAGLDCSKSVYEIILASALVGAAITKDGIKRVVNDLAPGESRLRVNR
jgi:hypothetical protein